MFEKESEKKEREKKKKDKGDKEEEEETSAGGIVLPGSAKEKPCQGEVVAVGTGRVLDNGDVRPVDVKVGDTIVFGKFAGSDTIEIDVKN